MEEAKPISRNWVTVDTVISLNPCLLYGVVLTGDGVGVADVTIRDGVNTGGDVILTLKAVQNGSSHAVFFAPVKAQKGLFCDVGSNVTGVLVLWDPIE